MPKTPWPDGHELKLNRDSSYNGDTSSTWNSELGDKVGKYYKLDDTNVDDFKTSSYSYKVTREMDDHQELQVVGISATGILMSGGYASWIIPRTNGTRSLDSTTGIQNDSLIGIIASTYTKDTDEFAVLKHKLAKDDSKNRRADDKKNIISNTYETIFAAAHGDQDYAYKYAKKSGGDYTPPEGRDMCPGNPKYWGFKANPDGNPSEIRCAYEWTKGNMNALAASTQNPGQGPDDPTNTYDQIDQILKTYCLKDDNYRIDDLGGTGDKLSCKDIVGDAGLLTDFCRSAGEDGKYNVVKYPNLCSFENLEEKPGLVKNYRNTWKKVCEAARMYERACDLFWATESTLASRPGDNPGITDPCSGPESERPPVCGVTQGIIDRLNEAFEQVNFNVTGINRAEERRLCYDGAGSTGSSAIYDWKKVTKKPELCTTQIQVCNSPINLNGVVNSVVNAAQSCTQNSGGGGGGGDPEIVEGDDPTEAARSPSDQPAPAPTPPPEEKSFVQRWWWVLLLVVVLVMMMVMGIVVVV